jgi:hypothetical protein
MPMQNAQGFRCLMPGSHRRGEPAAARAMNSGVGTIVRTLPQTKDRTPEDGARAAALSAAGISCHLPTEIRRGGNGASARTMGFTRSLPAPIARSAGMTSNGTSAGLAPPEHRPGSEPTQAHAAPRDRATLSIEALFPIVERVARGISGAAGYSYMGEDPQGAGLRYGLLGLRLDTGDMGGALRLAAVRDEQAALAALGEHAAAVLATAQAADRADRMQPLGGAPLWEEPWKSRLSAAAGRDIFRAAQNEYAVEELLKPAASLVLSRPTLASGSALAMALDLLAEMGRAVGLATLGQVLDTGVDGLVAFRDRIATACPPCRLRLDVLARDPVLNDWRPSASEETPQ